MSRLELMSGNWGLATTALGVGLCTSNRSAGLSSAGAGVALIDDAPLISVVTLSGKDNFFFGLGGTAGGLFFRVGVVLVGVAGCSLVLLSADPIEVLGVEGGVVAFFRMGLGDFSGSFTGCFGSL